MDKAYIVYYTIGNNDSQQDIVAGIFTDTENELGLKKANAYKDTKNQILIEEGLYNEMYKGGIKLLSYETSHKLGFEFRQMVDSGGAYFWAHEAGTNLNPDPSYEFDVRS